MAETRGSRDMRPNAPLLAPDQENMNEAMMDNVAYQALTEANLICYTHAVRGFDQLIFERGDWSAETQVLIQCACCPLMNCCGYIKYPIVEPGCVQQGSHQDGTNRFYGPGVYVLGPFYSIEDQAVRIADGSAVVNGTKAIVTVKQGYVGFALEKGEPILLPPGLHQWDNPDIRFQNFIDLSSSLITMGPYTLVTVEESYSAITQDNGKQKVLEGGKSYMLTHQNWKFQTWLSQKMQTDELGPLEITTGDNITLRITANVNWHIHDAIAAAGKNVDMTQGRDSLKLMRDDVKLQVTSSLAALVGTIQYGSKGTKGMNQTVRTGKTDQDDGTGDKEGEPGTEEEEKTGRQALWDPDRLKDAVSDANMICGRYGVSIFSMNLISVAPADAKLVEIMSRGAVAAVTAEETLRGARAEANANIITAQAQAAQAKAEAEAMLVKVRSEADALKLTASADAEAERIRAQGSKDAGLLMGESQVAVDIAKLKIAYSPFEDGNASTYFFGLSGPSDLPNAILGKSLAAETSKQGMAMAASR